MDFKGFTLGNGNNETETTEAHTTKNNTSLGSLGSSNKHFHSHNECNNILDLLQVNNHLQNDLNLLIVNINYQNQKIFKVIIKIFEYIYNAFDILISNSAMCHVNNNNYIIYDDKLKENYNTIKNYTNNYNINIITKLINTIFDTGKESYSHNLDMYIKSLQNVNLYSNEENINIIQKFIEIVNNFDLDDNKLSKIFTPIYNECIQMYTLAHTTIIFTTNTSSHFVKKSIQSQIFEELQKARILFFEIKKETDIFTESLTRIKPFITSYIDNCHLITSYYK